MGGTQTRLALFEPGRDDPLQLELYRSAEHGGLAEIVGDFAAAHPVEPAAATVGVAGPVHEGRTQAVNLAWPVDARELAAALGIPAARVSVINDLVANGWGIEALGPDDLASLNEGARDAGGNLALISAGTGLGEAFISRGPEGTEVHPSEGGHADFAPRSRLESELRDWLGRQGEHVSYERVCSGIGLVNIYEFLRSRSEPEPRWLTEEQRQGDEAAVISRAALEGRDPTAGEALDLMVSIYGAQAGNLVLTVMATGGVYLGGGIAPKLLPRLRDGGFMRAFAAKGRMAKLLERIPVEVILNEQTALLGASRHAMRAASS